MGLFFFPLFIGFVFFGINTVQKKLNIKLQFLLLAPVALIPMHFLANMNLSYCPGWKDEMIPSGFFGKIESYKSDSSNIPVVKGDNRLTINWTYLNFRHGGEFGQLYSAKDSSSFPDFQIVELKKNRGLLRDYVPIGFEKYSNLTLLKRKKDLEKTVLFSKDSELKTDASNAEYHDLAEFKADSLEGRSLICLFDLSFSSKEKPFKGWIVVSVLDSKRNTIYYDFITLDWLRSEWKNEPHNFIKTVLLPPLTKDASILKTYLWNREKAPFQISYAKCSFYEITTR